MTLRPLGPSVTLTASFKISTPRSMCERASVEKRTSLADMFDSNFEEERGLGSGGLFDREILLDHAENVGFFHDQEILGVDPNLRAGPLSEQHPIARFDLQR